MAKGNLLSWKKRNNPPEKSKLEYEGAAEKLLQYANDHPSARELTEVKLKAELRRWDIERRAPTIEEIQQRYNYTAEYAIKFLEKLERTRNLRVKKSASKVVKPAKQALAFLTPPALEPTQNKTGEIDGVSSKLVQLNLILEDIRRRYSEEIRNKGEQTNVREGFIYILISPCFPGWVKAGMTIDYDLRLGTYNTSDPLSRFKYVELAWTSDRRGAEQHLLAALQHAAAESRGEWFRLTLEEAVSIFDRFKRIS
ncbi:hypothetical protein C7H73_12600 [Pulveribacter suum]|uniref:Bacteriophage T5 Orf172 DNA-binding domain-containing protein n=2 Tax=Pulveribacter suum TaxID=2116657 RepID=A0A2P1NMZ6_9BURK|nr:hypothetical protein C7H73_12600 [Pulveribacter suum]